MFHQDSAPAHKSVLAMAVVRDCGFELVDNLPYSPDLAVGTIWLISFSQHEKAIVWEAVSDH